MNHPMEWSGKHLALHTQMIANENSSLNPMEKEILLSAAHVLEHLSARMVALRNVLAVANTEHDRIHQETVMERLEKEMEKDA